MGGDVSRGLINASHARFARVDSFSDMLTRIRNATLATKSSVNIPFTKLGLEFVKILEREGFIQSFHLTSQMQGTSAVLFSQTSHENAGGEGQVNPSEIIIRLKYISKELYKGQIKESCITNLRRISKPGLRIYANSREIPRILNGTGIAIISTPSGIMTDREARAKKLGGELLCSIW